EKNGEIEQPVDYGYIWGDALEIWKKVDPDFRIINLETSITNHPEPWPAKGVNYHMHPENVKVLTAAGIDFCSLANNHTMDWREEGLHETTQSLNNAGIAHAGAGKTLEEARNPQILKKDYALVIILSYGSKTSGIPGSWAATHDRAGVNMLPDFSDETIEMIGNQVKSVKQEDDIVVFSIHWGGNWGYDIPVRQQEFAHQLIDKAGVDIIHGHSSHHAKGIEIYKNRLIIYGAGDFINDYEGISGHDQYRDDLTLMYFPTLDPETGKLLSLKLAPLQIKKMRLNHVSEKDRQWLFSMLNREGQELGTRVTINEDGFFSLQKAKSSIQN
ncbi:MAG: CapA family protein, partial [Bacteroidales bacterium]|nr:CapA family protein [Bacteroidales bacterium]